jgi:hypothetical protein
MLSFSISYLDLIKFPYFEDLTQRGDGGVKGGTKTGWRQGEFKENSIIKEIIFQPQMVLLNYFMQHGRGLSLHPQVERPQNGVEFI